MTRPEPQANPVLLGLGLISAGMLAFEIGLTRLFSVQQFHHFAFMVVSLAVLGISASGLALSAWRRRPSLAWIAAGFSAAVGLSYLIVNQLPFDSYAIAWDRGQVWVLLVYFTAAGLPFLFAGWAAGASMEAAGEGAHLPYGVVFVGSALGAPAALAAHAWGGAAAVMLLAVCLGALSAACFSLSWRGRIPALAAALTLGALLLARPGWLEPTLSPYKPLAQARQAAGAQAEATRWDAVSRVDVLRGAGTHTYPGLSLRPGLDLPEQVAMFLDGAGPLAVTRLRPQSSGAAELAGRLPASAAYALRPGAQVLVVEPGGGLQVLAALASGAQSVTVPADHALARDTLAEAPLQGYSSDLLGQERVRLEPRASRGVMAGSVEQFDLIVYALSDPYRPVTSGAFSLQEDYLLTVESFAAAYRSLRPDGLLVVNRWLGTPPSESARAWATLLSALERESVGRPGEHLAAYRSMRTMTIIAARSPLGAVELEQLRGFFDQNGFDPVHLPGLRADEVNQHNQLPEPVYESLFGDLLRQPDETLAQHSFELEPPRDGRPYFFHFFRWRQTPDVLRSLGRSMQPFGGSGYFVLLALLALMLLLALPLIVLPLVLLRRRGSPSPGARSSLYFGALGAGYLLVEVPLISWFSLLLDHPATALATVLFTIMFASGLGSWLSPRIPLRRALFILVALIVATLLLLPAVVHAVLPWPLWARLAVAFSALLPTGVLMGVPFAAGLRLLERSRPGLIPWAWGVNGAISAISGVLAALIALDWGFGFVLAVAAASYALAHFTVPAAAGATTGTGS